MGVLGFCLADKRARLIVCSTGVELQLVAMLECVLRVCDHTPPRLRNATIGQTLFMSAPCVMRVDGVNDWETYTG